MKSFLTKFNRLFLACAVLVMSSGLTAMYSNLIHDETTVFDRVDSSFGKLFNGRFDQMDGDDCTRIIMTTGITAGVCYGIYWYLFNDHKKPAQPVELDTITSNNMCNRSLTHNVRLRQLQVAGQQGATCGYHALKNGILVVNALHGYNSATLQRDLLDTNLANRLINQWRGYVDARRRLVNERATGESLFDNEINDLFKIERNLRPDVSTARHHFNYPRTLSVVCELSILSEAYLNGQGGLGAIRSEFNNRRGLYSHIFILNSGGHWYTVVLHKDANGKREYIAMDTGRFDARRSAGVRNLIRHIEGAHVAHSI